MNIVYFIRLLLRRALLLIVLPVLLTVVVYMLTENQKRTYLTSSKIYTGFTTGSSIVSLQESKVDLFGSRAAFDNLISIISSRNTAEEVGLRLFTSHMMLESSSREIISEDSFQKLQSIIPSHVKELVVKGNFEKTYQNFLDYKNRDFNNFIYGLINYEHPHYSSKSIRKNLKVQRLQSSDIIEIVYQSDDPGIAYNTLKILNNFFINAYTELEVNQSGVVANYFEQQLGDAIEKLKGAEHELLVFNQENNIINYSEQTKHIASEKEHFSLDFMKIKMDYASAYSSIQVLESKMGVNTRSRINREEIRIIRDKLSDVYLRISLREMKIMQADFHDEKMERELLDLKVQAKILQEDVRQKVQEQAEIEYTSEGVSVSKILQDWLDQIVLFESAKARIAVGNERMKEFSEIFSIYAPMGATMKSLERKIGVYENEYLSLLNSLGLAKLKQQNKELNSNLKETEPPFFPLGPQPGKRKYLLIIAMLVGFVLPAFTIIALEFLDTTLKTAERTEVSTGLSVITIFPNLNTIRKSDNITYIKSKSLDVVARKLILGNSERTDKTKPLICVFYSHHNNEGKSYLTSALMDKIDEYGFKSILVTHDTPNVALANKRYINYEINSNIQSIENLESFSNEIKDINLKELNFVFVEIPSIIESIYPYLFLKKADFIFLALRANRSWDRADKHALKELRALNLKTEPQIILNGVHLLEMESILGDLPKRRSFIRKQIKNILRMQFLSHRQFSEKAQK
ncbi:MAG: hypothetical protein Q8R90_01435 [Bacteroidales bacterium]|nr:hypothetical protein [Bacteroidales bacterium]